MSHIKTNSILEMNKRSIDQIEINLIYVNKHKFEHDWDPIPHSHSFTEMFFILDGKGQAYVEGETFNIKKNDFLLISPNITHTEFSSFTSPLEYFVLGLDKVYFLDDKFKTHTYYKLENFLDINPYIIEYLEKCSYEAMNQDQYSQQIIQNMTENIVLELLRATTLNIEKFEDEESSNSSVLMAKNFIDKNFTSDISLDTLADLTQKSKYHLSRSFKEEYGITPINYLINKRIETSKTLLSSTSHQINQIADFVGYSSSSYFTEIFKKECGISPREYRNKTQKENFQTK